MRNLDEVLPQLEVVLGMHPADLAPYVLQVAGRQANGGMFHPGQLSTRVVGAGMAAMPGPLYGGRRPAEFESAIDEALQWLEHQALIVVVGGGNHGSGYLRLTRKGSAALISDAELIALRKGAAFPRGMLHPQIAERSWAPLVRGDLDNAVFLAFKAVEESVRYVGGFGPEDVGVALMRKAFAPDVGPLSNKAVPVAEQEALSHLFAGAIGSYKNPHSHRTVRLVETVDAQEMLALASHLMSIVQSRVKDWPAFLEALARGEL